MSTLGRGAYEIPAQRGVGAVSSPGRWQGRPRADRRAGRGAAEPEQSLSSIRDYDEVKTMRQYVQRSNGAASSTGAFQRPPIPIVTIGGDAGWS